MCFHTSNAHADETRCFESEGTKPTVYMTFTLPDNYSSYGSVRYSKGSANIVVRRLSIRALDENNERPIEFHSVWQEYIGKKKQGIYRIISQGAIVYDLSYQKNPQAKRISFKEQIECEPALTIHKK